MVDRDDLQLAVNLIVIGEAIIKAGKAIKKRLKKSKKKRPCKRKSK